MYLCVIYISETVDPIIKIDKTTQIKNNGKIIFRDIIYKYFKLCTKKTIQIYVLSKAKPYYINHHETSCINIRIYICVYVNYMIINATVQAKHLRLRKRMKIKLKTNSYSVLMSDANKFVHYIFSPSFFLRRPLVIITITLSVVTILMYYDVTTYLFEFDGVLSCTFSWHLLQSNSGGGVGGGTTRDEFLTKSHYLLSTNTSN